MSSVSEGSGDAVKLIEIDQGQLQSHVDGVVRDAMERNDHSNFFPKRSEVWRRLGLVVHWIPRRQVRLNIDDSPSEERIVLREPGANGEQRWLSVPREYCGVRER